MLGLALAGLVVVPSAILAQGGERRIRWELPGFDISPNGGWRVKARRVAAQRALLISQGAYAQLNAPLRAGPMPSTFAITGTFQVPMVLFFYKDTDSASAVRDTSQYNALLFGDSPPLGRPYTLKTYYQEMSNGLFTMQGRSLGWAKLDSNEVNYTGDPATSNCSGNGTFCNGLNSTDARRRMQRGLREALAKVDTGSSGIDFGLFDNDGPDGDPNSGDDDGYVDMMGFAHATQDGACGGNNHIWSHRWVLLNTNFNQLEPYVTNDPSAEGGTIRVLDYFIQSGLGGSATPPCDVSQIMPIGTAAHEFGHALGLPDLYDTGLATEGLGRWGLMGSGNYSSPNSPARMEAWSLTQMGWVTVVPLTTSGTYAFGAAQTGDTAFRVDVRGDNPRAEYFLLENRQAQVADTALVRNACQVWYQADITNCAGGLLIWHIDGSKILSGSSNNTVNAGGIGTVHGVKLEEADGARDLWCPGPVGPGCNRGDGGDSYPGPATNQDLSPRAAATAFTFTTNPAAVKNSDLGYVGFDIDQITQVSPGGEMSFRLTFDTTPALAIQTTTPRPGAVMGASYADTLVASGGNGIYQWSLFAGALPAGVTLASSGALAGRPRSAGLFSFTARVSSGGQVQTRSYSITVTAPVLVLTNVLTRLFDTGATTLSADEIFYLDYLGNNNGQFDVGDFKAWRDAGGGS